MAIPNLPRGGRCEKPPILLWAEALREHPDLRPASSAYGRTARPAVRTRTLSSRSPSGWRHDVSSCPTWPGHDLARIYNTTSPRVRSTE
jgi:hypothetical protein